MTATQLQNNKSVVVGGHVWPEPQVDSNGAALFSIANGTAVATLTGLKALAYAFDGQTFQVEADGSNWRYVAASTLTGDDILVATPSTLTGRFLRTDKEVDITAAVAYTTANNAVLYTVPTGFRLGLGVAFWEVTTSFAGGSSSAIGVSSSNTGLSTAGDVLGGASGDVAATLVSTGAFAKGTVGTKIGTPAAVIVGGETLKFNRITSVFTSGAGVAHFPVKVLLAPAS